jgi:DNA-binding NarL/FixJ family response regulator
MRVAIVDDHTLFAEGLAAWLRGRVPGLVSVYCGSDPAAALDYRPDVLLLDTDLGAEGPQVETVVARFTDSGIPVILVTDRDSGPRLRNALLAGAAGRVGKSDHPEDLLGTLTHVMDGNSALTRELAELMCTPGPPHLSPQELRALRLYCAGFPLKSVARQMGVGASTAKEYLDRVRAKYDAAGRPARTKTELANAARRDGLLDEVP